MASPKRLRELRRILLATIALAALYVGIQEAWLWSAAQLAYRGWTVNDPARVYAAEAADLAVRTRPLEAALPAGRWADVFQLGLDFGYVSQWLGGYGQQPPDVMFQLARPVASILTRLTNTAVQLGVSPIAPLEMRTAADFSRLSERIEADESGVAQRIEQVNSPRLRHLFLFGAHAGTQRAALESSGDLIPIPKTALIGQHATLAGVPEALWRPLARVESGTSAERRRAYLEAVEAVQRALGDSPTF